MNETILVHTRVRRVVRETDIGYSFLVRQENAFDLSYVMLL